MKPKSDEVVDNSRKSVVSDGRLSIFDTDTFGSDTDSFIESVNRQWYGSKCTQIIDPIAQFQKSKRYGKVYKSGDVMSISDFSTKRLSSQDRSSYSSSEFKWGSSTTSSMIWPSDESSVDFGSESLGVPTEDFEDIFHTEHRTQMPLSDVRYSTTSFSSFGTDKDPHANDFSLADFDTETNDSKEPQLSSSDESDALGETSKSRISAATLYEDAVSRVLENSRKHIDSSQTRMEKPIMETVSDSSVSMRGVFFNVYAKDKLDGILSSHSSDNNVARSFDDGIKNYSGQFKSCPRSPKEKFEANLKMFQNYPSVVSHGSNTPTVSIHTLNSVILSGVPQRMRLERHLSMDSSVSNNSDAETVIFNPTVDLSRNNSSASSNPTSNVCTDKLTMNRSVSAEGIIQTPKRHFKSESNRINDFYCSDKNQKLQFEIKQFATDERNASTIIASENVMTASKYYDNPSSDSMEEQELTMELSDSQVSEKEDTPTLEVVCVRRRSRLGQMLKEAPIEVEILPYEERQRSAFNTKCSKSSSSKKLLHRSKEVQPATTSSSDETDEGNGLLFVDQANFGVSSSMEVLYSSSEILDTTTKRSNPRAPTPYESLQPEASLIILRPMEITKNVLYRSSITSFNTDISDSCQIGFSETEDEIVNDETSDDDLTLEEEEIKLWVEVRRRKLIDLHQSEH